MKFQKRRKVPPKKKAKHATVPDLEGYIYVPKYKNPFEDPEAELWGTKIKDYKIPERKEILEERAKEIPGYVYVPSIKLYVAKEKSLHGLSWYDAHEELHKKGLQMLTIRQFIDFVLYLKQNKSNIPEAEKILDEILTPRESFRGEWLDAMFTEGADELYISYNHRKTFARHRIVKGKKVVGPELVAQNTELLEKCLMRYCFIDLKSCNKQGLPTKYYEGIGIGYEYPVGGRVAGCGAGLCNAYLTCEWTVSGNPDVGVRAAQKVK